MRAEESVSHSDSVVSTLEIPVETLDSAGFGLMVGLRELVPYPSP